MPIESCSNTGRNTSPRHVGAKADSNADGNDTSQDSPDTSQGQSSSTESNTHEQTGQGSLLAESDPAETETAATENCPMENGVVENSICNHSIFHGLMQATDSVSSSADSSQASDDVCQHRSSSGEGDINHVLGDASHDVDNENNRGDDESASDDSEDSGDESDFEGGDFTDDSVASELETSEEEESQENVPPGLEQPWRGYALAGPHRNRRQMARRRREEAQRSIAISGPILGIWRQIGVQWGLSNDSDIARVLLQHYEDVQAGRPPRPPPAPRCLGCGERLVPVPCDACGPNMHSHRLQHEREDRGGGGGGGSGGGGGFGGGFSGGDRYCGRCRD